MVEYSGFHASQYPCQPAVLQNLFRLAQKSRSLLWVIAVHRRPANLQTPSRRALFNFQCLYVAWTQKTVAYSPHMLLPGSSLNHCMVSWFDFVERKPMSFFITVRLKRINRVMKRKPLLSNSGLWSFRYGNSMQSSANPFRNWKGHDLAWKMSPCPCSQGGSPCADPCYT